MSGDGDDSPEKTEEKEVKKVYHRPDIEACPQEKTWRPPAIEVPLDYSVQFKNSVPDAMEWAKVPGNMEKDKCEGYFWIKDATMEKYYKIRDKKVKQADIEISPFEKKWTPPEEMKFLDRTKQFKESVPDAMLWAKKGEITQITDDKNKTHGYFILFDSKMQKYYKIKDKNIAVFEPSIDIIPQTPEFTVPPELKDRDLSEKFNHSVPRGEEWAKLGYVNKAVGYFYVKDAEQGKYYEIRDSSNFPGVTSEEAKVVINKTVDPYFAKALKSAINLEEICSSCNGNHVTDEVWQQMGRVLDRTMAEELKPSRFQFNRMVHRFSQVYPYDFNAMRNYFGSWTGDGFGMMWWPMPYEHNREILRQICVENKVGLIVAIGHQNANEEPAMPDYWEDLGTKWEESLKGDGIIRRACTGIGETNYALNCFQFLAWPDHDKPDLSGERDMFIPLFEEMDRVRKTGKTVIIHCRAGVGRSGTLRLMYKAWKRELKSAGVIAAMNRQRALRMHSIQQKVQFNFLIEYVKKMEARDETTTTNTTTAAATTTTTTTTMTTEPISTAPD